ncbi:MAG TPA: PAS domain-containing protein, partial [Pirellulales bacterium]|nr:PAS domain-containing protein [Pirellulales bacterium]
MTAKPKILVVRDPAAHDAPLPIVTDGYELEEVRSPLRALARMTREQFAGIFVAAGHIGEAIRMGKLLQNERILEGMPDGIVLLGADNTIIWGNGRLREWTGKESVIGENFYSVLNSPEILGPDFGPFHTALTTGKASSSVLRSGDNRYFHVHAAPVCEGNKAPEHLIVTVHDVTKEVLQQQKLAAIHQAGQELSDLTAEELSHMSIEERIKLLKSNILHYTKD